MILTRRTERQWKRQNMENARTRERNAQNVSNSLPPVRFDGDDDKEILYEEYEQ